MLISMLLGIEYYIQSLKVFTKYWLFSLLQDKYISFIVRYKSWFPWVYSVFYFITVYEIVQSFVYIKIPCIIFCINWFYSSGFDSVSKFSDEILHVKELWKVKRLKMFCNLFMCVKRIWWNQIELVFKILFSPSKTFTICYSFTKFS